MILDPNWISAYANIFASIGTVGAFAIGGALLSKEIGRDKTHVDDVQRLQPAAVHAFMQSIDAEVSDQAKLKLCSYYSAPPSTPDPGGTVAFRHEPEFDAYGMDRTNPISPTDRSFAFKLEVVNASAGPIFEVYVEQVGLLAALNISPQNRHKQPGRYLADKMPRRSIIYLPLIPVGKFEIWYSFYCDDPGASIAIDSPVSLAFTDCFGLRWQRNRDGALDKIEPNANPAWIDAAQYTIGLPGVKASSSQGSTTTTSGRLKVAEPSRTINHPSQD